MKTRSRAASTAGKAGTFNPALFDEKLAEVLDYHNFVLTQYLGAEPVSANEVARPAMAGSGAGHRAHGRDVSSNLFALQQEAQEPAVRRRSGRCSTSITPRTLSSPAATVGGRGVGRRGRRSAIAAIRAGHHQGFEHDPRRIGPVPHGVVDEIGTRLATIGKEFGSVTPCAAAVAGSMAPR